MGYNVDYKLTLGINDKDLQNEVINTFKNAKQSIENDRTVIKFSADTEELKKELNKIKENKVDLGNISLEFDTGRFKKETEILKNIAGKTASQISKKFSESMGDISNEMFKNIDFASIIKEKFGDVQRVTKNQVMSTINDMRTEMGNFDFGAKNLNFDDIVRYAERLEKISAIINQWNAGHKSNIELPDFTVQIKEFYDNIGTTISSIGVEKLSADLKELSETTISNITKMIRNMGMSGGGSSGDNFAQQLKEDIEDTENELNKLIKKKDELLKKKNDSKSSISELSALQDKMNGGAIGKNYDALAKQFLQKFNSVNKPSITDKENYKKYTTLQGTYKELLGLYRNVKIDLFDEAELKEVETSIDRISKKLNNLYSQQNKLEEGGFGAGNGNGDVSESEYNALEKELQNNKKLLSDANAQITKMQSEISALQENVQKLESENDKNLKAKDKSKADNKELKSKLQEAESEVTKLNELLNNANKAMDALDGHDISAKEFGEAQVHIDKLTSSLESYQNMYSGLLSDYNELDNKLQNTKGLLKESDSSNQSLVAERNELSQIQKELKQKLEESNQQIEEQKRLLNEAREASRLYTEQIADMQGSIIDEKARLVSQYGLNPYEQAVNHLNEGKFDGAAAYYGIYKNAGGKDNLIDEKGIDRTKELIARFKELLKLREEEKELRKNTVVSLNEANAKIRSSEETIKILNKENEALKEKQIRLEDIVKTQSKVNEQEKVSTGSTDNTNKSNEDAFAKAWAKRKGKATSKTDSDSSTTASISTTSQNVSSDVKNELSNLKLLESGVEAVTTKVKEKTQAFRDESATVAKVIPEETEYIGKLVSALKYVEDSLTNISNIITNLPPLNEKFNIENISLENINEDSLKAISKYVTDFGNLKNALKDSDIESDLKKLASGLSALKELGEIGNLKISVKDIKLDTLSKYAKESDKFVELATSIELISTAIRELSEVKVSDLSGLKMTDKNVQNVETMAYALDVLKTSLNSFDKNATDTLNVIKELTSQASALKDLNNIVKSPSKVGKAKEKVEDANRDASTDKSVEDAYKRLIKSEETYQTLLVKKEKNLLKSNEAARLKELSASREKDIDITKEAISKTGTLTDKQEELKKKYEETVISAKSFANSYKNELDKRAEKDIEKKKTDDRFNSLKGKYDIADINYAKQQIENFNKALDSTDGKIDKYQNNINSLFAELEKKEIRPNYIEADSFDDAISKAKQIVSEYKTVKKELSGSTSIDDNGIAKWSAQVRDADGHVKNLKFTYDSTSKSLIQDTKNVRNEMTGFAGTVDNIEDKFKQLALYWTANFFNPYDMINFFRQGIEIVHDYDDALTEMKKVSNDSIGVLRQFQKESFSLANEVGTTAEQLQNSTADFLRIGESLREAKESAKSANILLNVSEFESINEATESLISMSQAYSELDKMDIIDVLNNIGNNYAISTDGLATALQKSASSLKTANNDLYEAVALTTAGNVIAQDPDSVGAGKYMPEYIVICRYLIPESSYIG